MDGGTSNDRGTRPLVFVTVGTDGYPFERLISWVDDWLADGAASRVRCVVQHGTARQADHAESQAFFPFADLEQLIEQADVVVAHGGPGTILLCTNHGKKPIVVARLPEHREVVDEHQVSFARRLNAEGEVALAESQAAFRSTLELFLSDSTMARVSRNGDRDSTAVTRFEELVEALLA